MEAIAFLAVLFCVLVFYAAVINDPLASTIREYYEVREHGQEYTTSEHQQKPQHYTSMEAQPGSQRGANNEGHNVGEEAQFDSRGWFAPLTLFFNFMLMITAVWGSIVISQQLSEMARQNDAMEEGLEVTRLQTEIEAINMQQIGVQLGQTTLALEHSRKSHHLTWMQARPWLDVSSVQLENDLAPNVPPRATIPGQSHLTRTSSIVAS
jgi:hypothetical protein